MPTRYALFLCLTLGTPLAAQTPNPPARTDPRQGAAATTDTAFSDAPQRICPAVVPLEDDAFMNGWAVTPEQLLRGRLAGVRTNRRSWAPGGAMEVTLLGPQSLAQSSAPLYVIDGVPLISFDDAFFPQLTAELIDIAPQDVARIEVITNPADLARWGRQAANGVVLVETRPGAGKARFT